MDNAVAHGSAAHVAIVAQRSGACALSFDAVTNWGNVYHAFEKAAKGKRASRCVLAFEHKLADQLLELQEELREGAYTPQPYVHFYIHEPKRRKISAAAFRDRVVHHMLCNIIEPEFDRRFIANSFANRRGKGTHAAVDTLQALARRYRYVLRMDIVKHFPSIDHRILNRALRRVVRDERVLSLIEQIISSGAGVLDDEYIPRGFSGDDLLSTLRPRGLPIGNLTSQFWSNCYMHDFDLFVTRTLGCRAYLRYVDDFALFAQHKQTLWDWRERIIERLTKLRLTMHERQAQVTPVEHGIPWLGFVVYPYKRNLKGRNVRHGRRHLAQCYEKWRTGAISFAQFDASVQGWINHVRYADTYSLRTRMFEPFVWGRNGPL